MRAFLLVGILTAAFPAGAASPVDVFPLEQVRPGLRGEGITVLAGSTETRFGCTVIGVLPNFIGPGQDLVLARLTGDEIEYTGVVSGMSGSPVYVGGRLLGAVAYRLGAFSKEPIAGITPARLVLATEPEALHRPERPRAQLIPAAGRESFEPIETPLVLGGAPPGLLERYRDPLRAAGLSPVRGATGRRGRAPSPRDGAKRSPFTPGGAMAAVLIDGDLSVSAIGTVTHVAGDRVFGFGHSFLGRGGAQMPLAEAEVVTTLPSLAASTKIANVISIVGTVTDDRSAAVSGVIGALPPMMSIQVVVEGADGGRARGASSRFRYKVAEDPVLTPLLAELAVASALGGRIGFDAGGSVRVEVTIAIPGRPELKLVELLSVPDGASAAAVAAMWLGRRLATLWENPFEAISGVQVVMRAQFNPRPRHLQLVAGRVSPPSPRPGQDVTVAVELVDYRGERRQLRRVIALPAGLDPGKLKVHLVSHSGMATIDQKAGRRPTATSLFDVIGDLAAARRRDHLYLALVRSRGGLQVDGRSLPALPPSMHAILGRAMAGTERRALSRQVIAEEAIDVGAQVEGSVVLELDVLPREAPR